MPEDVDEARRVLRRLPDLGIDFITTADSYGPYVSEDLIAETFASYGDMKIATKGCLVRYPENPLQWPPVGNPGSLCQCVHMSLRRLKVDRIDPWQRRGA